MQYTYKELSKTSKMDRARFLLFLDELNLSQAEFAQIIGRDKATVYRWKTIPLYAEVILANLLVHQRDMVRLTMQEIKD